MRRIALVVLAGLSLGACASLGDREGGVAPPPPASAPAPSAPKAVRPAAPPAQAAPGVTTESLTYACPGGKRFTAAWGLSGDRVRVTAGGVTRILPQAPSASGARYSDGTYEIWGKGDEAMLSGFPGGPYKGCRTD